MAPLPINSFDAVVCVLAIVAVIAGFRSGLLRSVATILGYVAAMPFALALAPRVATGLDARMPMAADRAWLTFLAIFLVAGLLLSALLRVAVSETVGEHVSIPDRLAGFGPRRGANRAPGRADGRHLQPDHPLEPRAAVPRGVAPAAAPVDGRGAGPQDPATGCRRLHRSVEA